MTSRTKKLLLLAALVALPLVAWAAQSQGEDCCAPGEPCCPATSCPDPACCVR